MPTASDIKALRQQVGLNPRIVLNGNHTATDFDFIEANGSCLIKLPASPRKHSNVIIANGDGSRIRINGNGKNIKFRKLSREVITRIKGGSYRFAWFFEGPYWRIV